MQHLDFDDKAGNMKKVVKTMKKAVRRMKKDVTLEDLSEHEMLAIHDAFKQFDENGDGHIDRVEVKKVMGALIGRTPNEEQLGRILNKVDTDNDGVISLEEFQAMMLTRKKQTIALEKMFAGFDKNGDGFVSKEELQEGLKKAGFNKLTTDELNSLIGEIDKGKLSPKIVYLKSGAKGFLIADNDGQVNYKEFVEFFT